MNKKGQIFFAVAGLAVAILGVVVPFSVTLFQRESPFVVVMRDKRPAESVELVSADGVLFSLATSTGVAYPPRAYVGQKIFIRDGTTKREMCRFVLKWGMNEISLDGDRSN